MKKIYFNNRFIGITDLDDCTQDCSVEQITVTDYKDIPNLIKYFEESPSKEALILKSADKKALFEAFSGSFKRIDAAGGVVFNDKGEILMINRLEKWDLPKGKVEKKETVEVAAVREVEEECGISNVILEDSITTTYHVYFFKNVSVLKKTYWYQMRYEGVEPLVPQIAEDIVEAVWVDKNEVDQYLQNTYETIRDVFRQLNVRK